ncbi:MAG: class I mannose-6-phosphate isomerase [Kiritimatiellae bacterium]|nr:class I mannose-6-phosphate isomerase [Kiritimatiellia bacterium]
MNMPLCTPLVFTPVYKDNLWGGQRIAARYGRTGTPAVCAESWEISAHPAGPGTVSQGPFTGLRLDELARRYGADLTGTRAPDPAVFPLLFKIIDAQKALSVQIHPNNANAAATGGEPKTEMWVVLDAEPGAALYAGLKTGTTPESLRQALANGTIDQSLVKLDVQPGEVLFIPGGLVHAIGAGCLIYEVQQSSNTTYRFFDWNRTGPDGKPRTLHVEESFKTIDWSLPPPAMIRNGAAQAEGPNTWFDLVSCPYFTMRRLALAGPLTKRLANNETFHAFFTVSGTAALTAGGETVTLPAGSSALLPAAVSDFTVTPIGGSAELLVTTL